MKSIFVSSLFPNEIYEEISNQSIGAIANANNELQWNLYLGLKKYYSNLELINFPNVGSYPFRYKSISVPSCDIHYQNESIGYSYPFKNLLYLKNNFKYVSTKQALQKIVNSYSEIEVFRIFVYDLYPPFLKALTRIKRQNSHLKIHVCLIVPDIYGLTGNKETVFNRYFIKKDKKTIEDSYKIIDSFVLISENMREIIPIQNRPWTVVEGIFNKNRILKNSIPNIKINGESKNLFYSGALDVRNGVKNLLDAFKLINDKSYRLHICGDGELRSLVEDRKKEDSRIIYYGQLPHEHVIQIQSKMDLLINPRLPYQNFTKFSFPSKTMEYFASGIPTLMYRLEGVPDEYFNYCYLIQENEKYNTENISTLLYRIKEIFSIPFESRNNLALTAKKFILEEKTPELQCKKIYDMIDDNK